MQIVIDIPKDHKRVIDNLVIDGKGYLLPYEVEDTLAKAVKQGTPLPKGHGRLIDADAFKEYITSATEEIKPLFKKAEHAELAEEVTRQFARDIDEEPTIIEADNAESEVEL